MPTPQDQATLARLDAAVRAVAPIHGVSANVPGRTAAVQFNGANPQQQATALAVVEAFDWRPRRPRPAASIRADIAAALDTPGKVQAAVVNLLAYLATQDATVLRKLGHAIDGDEPEA